jgi:hypothetical protein
MDTPSPTPPPIIPNPETHHTPKIPILLGGLFLLITGLTAGYFIGNIDKKPNDVKQVVKISPTVIQQASIIPTSVTSSWDTYSLPSLNLEFKLPPKAASLGDMKEEIVSGEKGTQLCAQFMKKMLFIPQAYAGGGCVTERNPYIAIGTTSVDFEAGRGGGFTDLQGFITQNNEYKMLFVQQRVIDEFPQSIIKKVGNDNGVEIITVNGINAPESEQVGPTLLSSLGGNTGALINTKNKIYPGLAIIFYKDGLSTEEINQVLKSFKFTN